MLVFHDLLGFVQHPHHAKVMPKFCKRYCEVGDMINKALVEFNDEVKNHQFPGRQYSPYPISQLEVEKLCDALKKEGMGEAADAAQREFETHSRTADDA